MEKSQREIVVAEFISALVGDKTRPYGSNHAVSGGEVGALARGLKMGAARYEAGFKRLRHIKN